MREIEIGVSFSLTSPITFYGIDEVNALINAGAVIAAIVQGGVVTTGIDEDPNGVYISGFTMTVHLMEPPDGVQ